MRQDVSVGVCDYNIRTVRLPEVNRRQPDQRREILKRRRAVVAGERDRLLGAEAFRIGVRAKRRRHCHGNACPTYHVHICLLFIEWLCEICRMS